MSVERNKDGSISIKSINGSTTISRMVGVLDDKRKEKFQQWVEQCANLVTPCAHTIKETEQYFLEQCDVLPLSQNDRRMKNFQLNVVLNHCKDKIKHHASEFSFDMTNEEIEKWHKEENAVREEVMNSSPEHFGLNLRGYYLLHTERNEVFYKQAYHQAQKWMEHTNVNLEQIQMQDICFFFDETTEHFQASGENSLMRQLIAFRGVSMEDIQKRTPRFLWYISTLRDIGRLPDFIED